MNASIILFPGSNRERDVARALYRATGVAPRIVWHQDTELPQSDLIVLPGGFSYGDYLRSGAIAAHSPIMRSVREQARRGVAVLGICNGFQIMLEAGLLPGLLMRNARLKFQCRQVHLRTERTDTLFTTQYAKGQVIRVPIAHADGNYTASEDELARLEGEGRVVFRYCGADGQVHDEANANGSLRNIAGIADAAGRIMGLMPHPEDAVEDLHGHTDGVGFFAGLMERVA